jgi:hypothetical protein
LKAQNSYNFKANRDSFFKKNYSVLKNKSTSFDTARFSLRRITNSKQTISPDFATCKYGFFCKEELKIEKATRLPLRIRLGSLQQCNYYEGKQY